MSNSLAIATVTAALAQLVRTAAQGAVGGADVIIGRPEAPANGDAQPRVRLYLYQVTPNAALRNADLPTRRGNGEVLSDAILLGVVLVLASIGVIVLTLVVGHSGAEAVWAGVVRAGT